MEGPPVEGDRAEGLQAPTAHLPSLAAWRPEDSPSPPTAPDTLLGRETPGRQESHPGQPGQKDGRRGRGEAPPPAATATTGPHPDADRARTTGPPGVDTKARKG